MVVNNVERYEVMELSDIKAKEIELSGMKSEEIERIFAEVRKLTDAGYAVVVFTEDELDGLDPTDVESVMTQAGWDFIYENDANRV